MNDEQNLLTLPERVRLIRINTFFRNAAGNSFAFLLGGALMAWVLHEAGLDCRALGVWVAAIAVFSALNFACERWVARQGLDTRNVERLFRVRAGFGLGSCVVFGLGVFLLPPEGGEAIHAFALFVAAGVTTVAYLTYSTVFAYSVAVNVLVVLPYALAVFQRWWAGGGSFFLLLGLTTLAWQVVVVVKALRVSRASVEIIVADERLREEMQTRQQADLARRHSEERANKLANLLRLLCDNVPDMIWAKDLEGRYLFVNAALCEKILFAESTDEPIGKTFEEFARRERAGRPDDPRWFTIGEFTDDIERHTLSRDEPTSYEDSGYARGKLIHLDIHRSRFVDENGQVIGTVGSARDITERKAAEAFVQHLAHHDVLTDLPNRILLSDRARQAIAQARRDRGKLALLFIDLDNLKPVNDKLGHDVGDLLLKEVALRLKSVVTRRSDTVARLGGDEFVVLLHRINSERDAGLVAERLLEAVSRPFTILKHEIGLSASIGVAHFPQHGDEVNVLLKNADVAMYEAKNAGRNTYRVFGESAR